MAYKFCDGGLRKKYKNYGTGYVVLTLVGAFFALIMPRIGDVGQYDAWQWFGYVLWAVALFVVILQQRIKSQDKKLWDKRPPNSDTIR